jgi:hypothetical protein
LLLALDEFNLASTLEPGFVDARVAAGSCLSNLLFLNIKNPDRFVELIGQFRPLLKDAEASAPDNPRLLWVIGANLWSTPAELGGGQEAALTIYQRGLLAARSQKKVKNDALDPSWGEPELLMNLAWSNLNRTTPDLDAAEEYACSALALVPYWHYVRDILIPQIRDAKAKRNQIAYVPRNRHYMGQIAMAAREPATRCYSTMEK